MQTQPARPARALCLPGRTAPGLLERDSGPPLLLPCLFSLRVKSRCVPFGLSRLEISGAGVYYRFMSYYLMLYDIYTYISCYL